jgi:hypothetical protein
MSIQTVPFFYDNQIRRLITQFIRMISGFQVQFGANDPVTGALALQTVPVMYGDQSRQAAQILKGVTENAMATVPAMAVYISALDFDQARLQDPFMISKNYIRERKIDPDTGEPTTEQGDTLTVEKPMPVPYRLTLKLDIWTSNTEQKLQLIEQIATLFNPALEIQSSDNYIDWTSLTYVLLTQTSWDSRTVPTGGEEPISIATMTFEMPIWISTAVRVSRMGIIETVLTNGQFSERGQDLLEAVAGGFGTATAENGFITPKRATNILNYSIELRGNQIRLLRVQDTAFDPAFVNASNTQGGRGGRVKILEVDENGAITSLVMRSAGNSWPSAAYKVPLIGGNGGTGATVTWGGGTNGELPTVFVDDPTKVKKGTPFIYLHENGSGYYQNDTLSVKSVIQTTGSSGNIISSPLENYGCPFTGDPNELGDYIINRAGENYEWETFVEKIGSIRPGLTEVRLQPDTGGEIIGTVAVHPADPNLLIFDVYPDTVPGNTLAPLSAIIDPNKPGVENLVFDNLGNYIAAAGTRYLLVDNIGNEQTQTSVPAWTPNGYPLVASANDIIEFDGTRWNISFDSRRQTDKQYVVNMTTGIQYCWTGESWVRAHDGIYRGGRWSLIL